MTLRKYVSKSKIILSVAKINIQPATANSQFEAETIALELSRANKDFFFYVFQSRSVFNRFRVDYLGIIFSDEFPIVTYHQGFKQ